MKDETMLVFMRLVLKGLELCLRNMLLFKDAKPKETYSWIAECKRFEENLKSKKG